MFLFLYIEPHPPTNFSAVVQCRQGYDIQMDWQVNTVTCNNLKLYVVQFVSKGSPTPRQVPSFCHIM